VRFLVACFAIVVVAASIGQAVDDSFQLARGTIFGCVFAITVVTIIVAGFIAAARGRLRREPISPTDTEVSMHGRLGESDFYDAVGDMGEVGGGDGGGDGGGGD
jgi:hypothetical protein